MIILRIRQTSNGVYEITPKSKSVFFLRDEYLSSVSIESLVCIKDSVEGVSFGEDETNDIEHASCVYKIECEAMRYLCRAEHCRELLLRKLAKKGYLIEDIEKSLDYLVSVGYLDDVRYAKAWLNTRFIDHAEGRKKLYAELYQRGIAKDDAKKALDCFFSERTEEDICIRAYNKILRINKNLSAEKIKASLFRLGFSTSSVRYALNGK